MFCAIAVIEKRRNKNKSDFFILIDLWLLNSDVLNFYTLKNH